MATMCLDNCTLAASNILTVSQSNLSLILSVSWHLCLGESTTRSLCIWRNGRGCDADERRSHAAGQAVNTAAAARGDNTASNVYVLCFGLDQFRLISSLL